MDVLIHDGTGEVFLGNVGFDWSPEIVDPVDPTKLPAGTQIKMSLHHSTVLPDFDFETYSEAGYVVDPHTGKVRGTGSQGKGGLPVVGTPVYAEHPSTEILSLSFDLKDGLGRRRWLPGMPAPLDLLNHVQRGELIEAFNITFEFWIWNMVAVRRLGWPVLRLEQCRCAMAKARRHSLPGGLDDLAGVLGTPQKDPEGKRLLDKLTRPHAPTKGRQAIRWTPATAWDDFVKLYDYNDTDIVAEAHVSARVPDLTPYELSVWQMDQTINARGVQVDLVTLDAALDVLGQAERKYTVELATLTGGAVGSVSEVEKFGNWLRSIGVPLYDLTADTVTTALKRNDLPPAARRALEIRDSLGSSNVKKLRTLRVQVSSDGRLRDQYRYCGADRTGRWAAGGVQLQNITAKGPKTVRCRACGLLFGRDIVAIGCPRCNDWVQGRDEQPEWTIEAVEQAIADIRTANLAFVEHVWGDPIAVLCGVLRGLFVARPGHKLVCCDFSAIEAVAAACLARCNWRIEVFSTHGKIYEASAAKATGIPFEEILDYKKRTGSHHPARKGVGKIRELAGGYGGWIKAWKNFGADDFFADDAAITADVLKWREESPEIVDMWGGQFRWCGPGKWDYRPELFGLEGAAIAAIQKPGTCYSHHDIIYGVADDILFCRLPSGRFLHYHRPRLVPAVDKLNRGPCVQISFEGYNSNATKGPIGWLRQETYGGRLFENCIAEGTLVLTSYGWVAIEQIRPDHVVHDGVDWVRHGGLLYKNKQTCVRVDGVAMTPDHEVLTNDGWKIAAQRPRPYRPDLRDVDRFTTVRFDGQKAKMAFLLRVWRNLREGGGRRYKGIETRAAVQLRVFHSPVNRRVPHFAWYEPTPGICGVQIDGRSMHAPLTPSLGKLRGPRHTGLRRMAAILRSFLARYGAYVSTGRSNRSDREQRALLPEKLPMGPGENQCQQQTVECRHQYACGAHDYIRSGGFERDREDDDLLPPCCGLADCRAFSDAGRSESLPVYDILNAGPRQRFVVMGDGGPFIVHNCVQAVSCDIQAEALLRCEARGYPIVMHTHDEGCAEVPDNPQFNVKTMAAVMSERPSWATWWPLKAAGWEHHRYQKD